MYIHYLKKVMIISYRNTTKLVIHSKTNLCVKIICNTAYKIPNPTINIA